MRTLHPITLLTAGLLLTLAAAALPADEILDGWRRELDARQMGILERADWMERAVRERHRGAKLTDLKRFLEDPIRARGYSDRTAAALALGRFGARHLAGGLESPNHEVRTYTAIAAVGTITDSYVPGDLTRYVAPERFTPHGHSVVDSVEAFFEGLEGDDPDQRVFCLAVLRTYRPSWDPTFLQLRTGQLLDGLESESALVRYGAALGLRGRVFDRMRQRVADALREAARDEDPRVRRAAVEALAYVRLRAWPDARAAIARALSDENAGVATAAADALLYARSHDERDVGGAAGALPAAFDRAREPFARAAMIRAMATIGGATDGETGNACFDRLCAALADDSPVVRLEATRYAPRFKARPILTAAALLSRADDPEASVRAAALNSLHWIQLPEPSPEVARAALRGARDPSPAVRSSAARLMLKFASLGRPCIARLMRVPLRDRTWFVRDSATAALWKLGPDARVCLPELIASLREDDVPWAARRIILRLGADAVPGLVDQLHRGGPRRRADVADLLGAIGEPAFPALKELLASLREERRAAALAGFARAGPMAMFAAEDELVGAAAAETGATGALAGWAVYRVYRRSSPRATLRDSAERNPWCAWALAQVARETPAVFRGHEDELARLLRHPDDATADAAADALAERGVLPPSETERFADPALPRVALIGQLKIAEDPRRRVAAARTLRARSVTRGQSVRDAVQAAYGVAIETPSPSGRWVRFPEVGGIAAPLKVAAARAAAERRILAAIAPYPPTLIRAHLERVLLVATLTVGRAQYGGTYHQKTIYLATAPGSGLDLERMFHHELSSLLRDDERFPRKAWEKILPAGHSYHRGGRAAIRAGQTGGVSDGLFRDGFFKPYATSDLENDFNVFTEMVMTYPGWARTVAEHHPRLAAKWKVWRAYLTALDPHFAPPAPPR